MPTHVHQNMGRLECSRNETSCEQNLLSRRFEISYFASYVNVLYSESKIVDIWVIPAISNPFQVKKKKLKFMKFLLKGKAKLYSH